MGGHLKLEALIPSDVYETTLNPMGGHLKLEALIPLINARDWLIRMGGHLKLEALTPSKVKVARKSRWEDISNWRL